MYVTDNRQEEQQPLPHLLQEVDTKHTHLLLVTETSHGNRIMAYYAVLNENNIVTQVKSAGDESDWNGEVEWEKETGLVHKRTSYNTIGGVHELGGTPFRKNYACVGYTYDDSKDAFIPPTPYPSWILNEDTCQWDAPKTYPDDGKYYEWNEETKTWDLQE